jgi:hypothetical protein
MRRTRRKHPARSRKPLNVCVTDPDVLTLHQVASFVAETTGIKPHANTVTRWIIRGARGHRLAATRVGHLYAVRRDAVLAFLAATNADASGTVDSEAIRKARAEESKRRHRILASDLGLDN